METEFVPYELAVKLKELGFDEPCLFLYNSTDDDPKPFLANPAEATDWNTLYVHRTNKHLMSAPTYSQAFRWFREKQAIEGFIHKAIEGTYYFVIKRLGNNESNMYEFITNAPKNVDTYEEAELACLRKLIEIVKTK